MFLNDFSFSGIVGPSLRPGKVWSELIRDRQLIFTESSLSSFDWWLIIVLLIIPLLLIGLFWWGVRPGSKSSIIIKGKLGSVEKLPEGMDPVGLVLWVDGEIGGKENAKCIPLLRSEGFGIETGNPGECRFEDSAFTFPIDFEPSTEPVKSPGFFANLLSKPTVTNEINIPVSIKISLVSEKTREPLFSGIFKNITLSSKEGSPSSEEKVALEGSGPQSGYSVMSNISYNVVPAGSHLARLMASEGVLRASIKQQEFYSLIAHLSALLLAGLLLGGGIRFLFSGSFAASVVALVVGICEIISTLPVVVVWAGFASDGLEGKLQKIAKLNSQIRSALGVLAALLVGTVGGLTGDNDNAKIWWNITSLGLLANGALYGYVFVKSEAKGDLGALFHPNFLVPVDKGNEPGGKGSESVKGIEPAKP